MNLKINILKSNVSLVDTFRLPQENKFVDSGKRNVIFMLNGYVQCTRGDIMRTQNIFPIIICVISLATQGCSKSENQIVNPPSDTNLLVNGSFEISGGASLQGWQTNTSDTAFISFSTDVPINGGSFSLRLRNEWTFPGAVWQTIVPSSGTHRYRLSASAKVLRSGAMADGRISIGIKQAGIWNTTKSFSFSDTMWTEIVMLDTLTTVTGDTLRVSLAGGGTQFSFGYALFDLVKFQKLD
ncbi:MAG: hypothetical protein IGBAC_0461 [Ignavibacteriae bacterium]|nr:MAG: hypothetical protein IGBAC_0461 [Ignavibacteriota bacterium]